MRGYYENACHVGFDVVDWIHVVRRDQWRAIVITIMNLLVI
jgi:hypothetical protein